MSALTIPVIGIAAWSGTGKTTLLTKLIRIFRQKGLHIAVVKHAHHNFEIDYPGKDSYELRKAGASQVLIGSKKRWALIVDREEEKELELDDHLQHMDLDGLDLIFIEGFKPTAIPKIEIHRPALGKPYLFPDDNSIIAIATDTPTTLDTTLPILDLNQAEEIADFIFDRYLNDRKIANKQEA